MIERRLRHLRVATAAAALMAGCVPALSRNRTPGPLPAVFDARTVELQYYWRGMPGSREVLWRFRLERQDSSYVFTGTTELTVGRTKAGPLPVTVPDSAMRAFLHALASAPLRKGVYHPPYTHDDDYPEYTTTLRSDSGVVEFFSRTRSARPWRVIMRGEQYVSDSSVPSDAKDHLAPFYRTADLDKILTDAGLVKE